MSELKACPFCGENGDVAEHHIWSDAVECYNCGAYMHIVDWQSRPIEDALNAEITRLTAELAELKSENVTQNKKLTDYENELPRSQNYNRTCQTCRYLDESRECVLGNRCVNYALWQRRIL